MYSVVRGDDIIVDMGHKDLREVGNGFAVRTEAKENGDKHILVYRKAKGQYVLIADLPGYDIGNNPLY